jgi:hypothetical protein
MQRVIAWSLFVVCSITSATSARIMLPQSVAAYRIIAAAEKRLAANPNDAEAHYTIGRVHYLVWLFRYDFVPGFDRADGLELAPDWVIGPRETYLNRLLANEAGERVRERLGWDGSTARPETFTAEYIAEQQALRDAHWAPPVPPQEVLDRHATEGLKALRRAVSLDPNSAMYLLCLAQLQEAFADRAAELGMDPDSAAPPAGAPLDRAARARSWRNAAAAGYAKAYALAIVKDQKVNRASLAGIEALVSFGAIESYLRLAGYRSNGAGPLVPSTQPTADVDDGLVQVMQEELRKLGAIAPRIPR